MFIYGTLVINTKKLTTLKSLRGYITEELVLDVMGYDEIHLIEKLEKFFSSIISVYGDRDIWNRILPDIISLARQGESFRIDNEIAISYTFPTQGINKQHLAY